jgi:hypothetical protein
MMNTDDGDYSMLAESAPNAPTEYKVDLCGTHIDFVLIDR